VYSRAELAKKREFSRKIAILEPFSHTKKSPQKLQKDTD